MTDREDFVSKVWSYALIENPRLIKEDDGTLRVDFDFNDISTSLTWENDEEHPTLSDYVDFWLAGYEEPVEVYVGDLL